MEKVVVSALAISVRSLTSSFPYGRIRGYIELSFNLYQLLIHTIYDH